MDYALVASGTVTLIISAMTNISPDIASKFLFRALPFAASVVPIIAGLAGLGVI